MYNTSDMKSPEKDPENDTNYKLSHTLDSNPNGGGSFLEPFDGRKEMEFDTFDTFFFYSLHMIKKWMFLLPLYLDFIDFNRMKRLITSSISTFKSQEFGIAKRTIVIIVMIPVGIVLLIYGLLLLIVLFLLAILAYISIIFFIDLPFWITVSIQSVLLYLLICFPVDVSKQELSAAFLVTALWWIQLIWLLIFTLVMLQEIDDAMNSVIYISTYYNNKKLKSRNTFVFYTTVSCMPQMVQLLITFICASYASDLIFKNVDYLTPFLHFSGLFVILKIDSFIMRVLRGSLLYMPPVNAYQEIENVAEVERLQKEETIKREAEIEREIKKKQRTMNTETNKNLENYGNLENLENVENAEKLGFEKFEKFGKLEKPENLEKIGNMEEIDEKNDQKMEERLLNEKKYAWYRVHFPARHIMKFFEYKIVTNVAHFFFHNLEPTDSDLIDLVRLKYFLMGLGIFIIFAHVLKICLQLACNCQIY